MIVFVLMHSHDLLIAVRKVHIICICTGREQRTADFLLGVPAPRQRYCYTCCEINVLAGQGWQCSKHHGSVWPLLWNRSMMYCMCRYRKRKRLPDTPFWRLCRKLSEMASVIVNDGRHCPRSQLDEVEELTIEELEELEDPDPRASSSAAAAVPMWFAIASQKSHRPLSNPRCDAKPRTCHGSWLQGTHKQQAWPLIEILMFWGDFT